MIWGAVLGVERIVKRLRDALYYLTEWGKVEKAEVDYINRAYREIAEAVYELERIKKSLPEVEKKGIIDRLKEAMARIKEAVRELSMGRSNPARYNISYARNVVADTQRQLARLLAESVMERISRAEQLFRELEALGAVA